MNQLFQKVRQQGLAILVSSITSFAVASAVFYSRADDYIEEAYKNAAVKFRSEFIISCDQDRLPANIPDVFSKNETFKQAKAEESVLGLKKGFEFYVDDHVCAEGSGGRCIGQEYTFSVVSEVMHGVVEDLTIYNYSGRTLPSSYILLLDYDHDGSLDRISVIDKVNNTDITIRRVRTGKLEYENVDEKGAKEIYDFYTLKFNTFKIEYNIDKRILDYEPKIEIREITLEKTGK